jgi:hypothetical protein
MGSRLGFLSILAAAIPLAFILVPLPAWLPQNNLAGYIVICGGAGVSSLLAVGAGLIGSRGWFFALLGPAMVAALVLFNP